MHFVTVESCIRVGGPIFHNVTVEIWSEGPIFSGDQNYRDSTILREWYVIYTWHELRHIKNLLEWYVVTATGVIATCTGVTRDHQGHRKVNHRTVPLICLAAVYSAFHAHLLYIIHTCTTSVHTNILLRSVRYLFISCALLWLMQL